MNNTNLETFHNAMNHWRDAKGVGTALIPAPLDDKYMVLGILERVYSRAPSADVLIIVDKFSDRTDLIEYLTTQGPEENNNEFGRLIRTGDLKLFTTSYIETHPAALHCTLLAILYRPANLKPLLVEALNKAKFKLVIINQLFSSAEYMTTLYKICPLLDDFKQKELDLIKTSMPVDEVRYGVDIEKDSEDAKLLDYYNQYISSSMAIFGTFERMDAARNGDSKVGVSATQICAQLAAENGWNEHLDMSVEFNQQIDALYNPMSLQERSSQTYEIMRNRNVLLSSYKGKLDVIANLVKERPNARILIISKRAEFAKTITDYLNTLSPTPICVDYHNHLDNIPAVDSFGRPLLFKNGTKAGQQRMLGPQAQKTANMAKFKFGKVNVMSTNNSPDKELDIDVDTVIITSPYCESIKNYMYRLTKLSYPKEKITLFTVYCRNTPEEKVLNNLELAENHNVTESCEKSINFDDSMDYFVED